MRAITGAPVADCTSDFRCWRRDALGRIPLDRLASNGYAFLIETLHEALRRGARIGEVPIVFVERSKVSLNALAESLIMPGEPVSARACDERPDDRRRARCAPAHVSRGGEPARSAPPRPASTACILLCPTVKPPQPAVVAGNSVP